MTAERLVGYCPNCGRAIEHDGNSAECVHCSIQWRGDVADFLKAEPYEPGELEAHHELSTRRFEEMHRPE